MTTLLRAGSLVSWVRWEKLRHSAASLSSSIKCVSRQDLERANVVTVMKTFFWTSKYFHIRKQPPLGCLHHNTSNVVCVSKLMNISSPQCPLQWRKVCRGGPRESHTLTVASLSLRFCIRLTSKVFDFTSLSPNLIRFLPFFFNVCTSILKHRTCHTHVWMYLMSVICLLMPALCLGK